jgi:hypothetical protein
LIADEALALAAFHTPMAPTRIRLNAQTNGEGDNSAANDHRGGVESRDGNSRPEVPAHERDRRQRLF